MKIEYAPVRELRAIKTSLLHRRQQEAGPGQIFAPLGAGRSVRR